MNAAPTPADAAPARSPSGWTPLRYDARRRAIQATNLPVLALAIPGGVLGDLLNRKRLILFGQFVMLVSAAALGVLDVAGAVTPAVLLIVLCGIGVGQGITGPTAQTLQPELLPASERSQAIALGSVNQNLARAIGPAIGGLLLAATSAAVVFFVNSLSGLWALLPIVARRTLGSGSGGYGLLLGCVGIGAVLGATFSPAIRKALSPSQLLLACGAAIAITALVMAVSHTVVLDGAALVLAGTGWIVGLGLLNASFQSTLPSWVKARGMAYFTVAFQGATGIGAVALGAVAQLTSLNTGLIVLAGLFVGGR